MCKPLNRQLIDNNIDAIPSFSYLVVSCNYFCCVIFMYRNKYQISNIKNMKQKQIADLGFIQCVC